MKNFIFAVLLIFLSGKTKAETTIPLAEIRCDFEKRLNQKPVLKLLSRDNNRERDDENHARARVRNQSQDNSDRLMQIEDEIMRFELLKKKSIESNITNPNLNLITQITSMDSKIQSLKVEQEHLFKFGDVYYAKLAVKRYEKHISEPESAELEAIEATGNRRYAFLARLQKEKILKNQMMAPEDAAELEGLIKCHGDSVCAQIYVKLALWHHITDCERQEWAYTEKKYQESK